MRSTRWNESLSESTYNMIKTHRFIREADPNEPEMTRLVKEPHFELCLDKLTALDRKDTLIWPKLNRPIEKGGLSDHVIIM